MAKSVDHELDVRSGSTVFAEACLSEYEVVREAQQGRIQKGSRGSVETQLWPISFEILDKFYKFGIPYLPIIFISHIWPTSVQQVWLCVVANSVDPDQTPRYAASDLGLHRLPRPTCPNT